MCKCTKVLERCTKLNGCLLWGGRDEADLLLHFLLYMLLCHLIFLKLDYL